MGEFRRRDVLATGAALLVGNVAGKAGIIEGRAPWKPRAGGHPKPVTAGGWVYFTDAEAKTVEAIADRLIPPDPETPGGKDIGCAVFIDRQLAGPYGSSEGLYNSPPFLQGKPNQGPQLDTNPARNYRIGLEALNRYCQGKFGGKAFFSLTGDQQDEVLHGLEDGKIQLPPISGQSFFKLLLTDTQEGFFADPVYGGNRDMAAWKMIGFPGARYDYRDWVERHNEPYPRPPVSIAGSPDWNPRKS